MEEHAPNEGGNSTPPDETPTAGDGEGGKPARSRRRRVRSKSGRAGRDRATEPVREDRAAKSASTIEPRRRPDDVRRTRRRDRPSKRRGDHPTPNTDGAPASLAADPSSASKYRAPRAKAGKRASASASTAPGRTFWIAVAVLTIVALLVRLPGLGGGLWTDEISSIMESFRTPFPETLSIFPGDNKHPLYALLAHGALSAFGESAWSVRLPALLFGVATVPMLYALGTRITSRAESFATAALLAMSYHHVWFSQNARGYSALAFFAVLATWLLLGALRSDGYRLWIWYAVAAGLGVYTHLTLVFTVIAQFIVVTLAVLGWPASDRRVSWRGPLLGFGLSALIAIVLYLPMFSQVMAFFLHKESNLKGISSPTWALGEAIRVLRLGFGGAIGVGLLALGIGALVGLAGALSYARQRLRIFLLLTLPAVVTVMGAFAVRGTMYPRFFFMLAGFALLIGIRGAFVAGAWIARRLRWSEAAGHRLGSLVAATVVLVSALSVPLNWRAPKQDFEGAAAYVQRSASAGDAIVTADVTSVIYGPYYGKTWRALKSAGELEEMRRADASSGTPGRRVWLVYTFPRYLEKFNSELAAYVRRECTSANVQRFRGTVGDGDLLVCRLDRA